MLPFTAEVLFSLLEQYNRAIWPAQIVAFGFGLAAILLALRSAPGGGRLIGVMLAAAWAWIGVVYHLVHFGTINFAAPVFAGFFVVQALLLGWTATLRGKVAFRFRPDLFGWSGLGLAIFAMAIYPLVGWLAGHGWPRAPVVGAAPGPTTIFTIGMLLLTAGRTPLHLVVIPVLWSLVGGMMAWLLNIPQGLALPLAGVGGLGLILWKNRRRRSADRIS